MDKLLDFNLIVTIFSFAALLSTLFSLFTTRYFSIESKKKSLDEYKDKVQSLIKSISEEKLVNGNSDTPTTITVNKKTDNYEDNLIELAVHQTFMELHQKQAINHSRIQFYTGLIMSMIGFILIIYVVIIALSSNNNLTSAITIVGSIVFEGISILFLKESNRLRQSAKEYHDNLSENNRQLQALKIAESIENPEIKSAIKAQLALHLIGIHSENIDTTKILEAMSKN